MCRAISILKSRINQELIDTYQLSGRMKQRTHAAEEELVFDYADRVHAPQLPVIHAGQMHIYEWGNRAGQVEKLPKTGWCRQESFAEGKWRWLEPEPVIIPAQFGLEKGVWFSLTEGIQAVAVADLNQQWHVYMLTKQASVYYSNMTRHDRMPVLVGESI